MRATSLLAGLLTLVLAATVAPAADKNVRELFNGRNLDGWAVTDFGGQGEVEVSEGKITAKMGAVLTGIHFTNSIPTNRYELSLEAMKIEGQDFFCALTFPVGASHCSLIVGGWGGSVVGLSNVDSMDASENETTKYDKFEKGRWYRIRVAVTPEKIQAWIGEDRLVNLELKDRKISLRPGPIELSVPLGLANYQTTCAWRNIRLTELPEAKP